jgi:putative transposase
MVIALLSHMPRHHRIQQNEFPYHVTTQTNAKRFVLKKWVYKIIIAVLNEASVKYNAHIHHFKLMDSHYHMKLQTPESNISTIMWYINNQIAKRMNKRSGSSGHVWGSRFSCSIVQDDKHALQCVKYIYNNGVRAGLCKQASEDPRLSSFEFYARGKKIEFTVVEDTVFLMLGINEQERRLNFVKVINEQQLSEVEINQIRKRLRKMFFGSADFIERMKARYLGTV